MTVQPPLGKLDGRGRLLVVTYGMTVYLTVREVATMARCEHKSVRRAIAAGSLRAFRPANKLLIREDDAHTWIEGRPAAMAGSAPSLRPAPARRRSTLGSQRPGSVADLREIERKAV
jgi:excisionase family DNA binding protein